MSIPTAILTISDRISQGNAVDKTGEELYKILSEAGKFDVLMRVISSDEKKEIVTCLREASNKVSLIVCTGGTGFGVRDNTPEAVREVIEKEATGLTISMMNSSLTKTPLAALSRPVCGIVGKTVIITLPGSTKGAIENLQAILPILPHAIELASGTKNAGEDFHKSLHGGHTCIHKSDIISEAKPGLSTDPSLPISKRPRTSPYPLTPLDKAHVLITSFITPLPSITKPLLESLGYVISEDIFSTIDIPPHPTSIVDGYAVPSLNEGIYSVSGHILAQDNPGELNGIVRVNTGSRLPEGTKAVVMVEDSKVISLIGDKEDKVWVAGSVLNGNIRDIGSDVAKGEKVLAKGDVIGLSGGEIGVLASIGVDKVKAVGKPIVGVMSTGSEVGGVVKDANRPALISIIRGYGYDVLDLGIVPDDIDLLASNLKSALNKVDVLVTTGGVSMGEADFLKTVLERKLGGTIHFGRVNIKPGKPTTFATVEKKLVFALPGNPVSALVMFRVFVLPALKRLSGKSGEELWIKVKLGHEIRLDPRPEFYRVRLEQKGGDFLVAAATGNQRSSRVKSVAGAMGLVKLPSSQKGEILPAGSLVEAILL